MTQWTIIFAILKLKETFRKWFMFNPMLECIQCVWPFFQIMKQAQCSLLDVSETTHYTWLCCCCCQGNSDYVQRANVTAKSTCHPAFHELIHDIVPMRGKMNISGKLSLYWCRYCFWCSSFLLHTWNVTMMSKREAITW